MEEDIPNSMHQIIASLELQVDAAYLETRHARHQLGKKHLLLQKGQEVISHRAEWKTSAAEEGRGSDKHHTSKEEESTDHSLFTLVSNIEVSTTGEKWLARFTLEGSSPTYWEDHGVVFGALSGSSAMSSLSRCVGPYGKRLDVYISMEVSCNEERRVVHLYALVWSLREGVHEALRRTDSTEKRETDSDEPPSYSNRSTSPVFIGTIVLDNEQWFQRFQGKEDGAWCDSMHIGKIKSAHQDGGMEHILMRLPQWVPSLYIACPIDADFVDAVGKALPDWKRSLSSSPAEDTIPSQIFKACPSDGSMLLVAREVNIEHANWSEITVSSRNVDAMWIILKKLRKELGLAYESSRRNVPVMFLCKRDHTMQQRQLLSNATNAMIDEIDAFVEWIDALQTDEEIFGECGDAVRNHDSGGDVAMKEGDKMRFGDEAQKRTTHAMMRTDENLLRAFRMSTVAIDAFE